MHLVCCTEGGGRSSSNEKSVEVLVAVYLVCIPLLSFVVLWETFPSLSSLLPLCLMGAAEFFFFLSPFVILHDRVLLSLFPLTLMPPFPILGIGPLRFLLPTLFFFFAPSMVPEPALFVFLSHISSNGGFSSSSSSSSLD